MVKHYTKQEMTQRGLALICPECVGHTQVEHIQRENDCKNTYTVSEEPYSEGQCCCWSEAHGIRNE